VNISTHEMRREREREREREEGKLTFFKRYDRSASTIWRMAALSS